MSKPVDYFLSLNALLGWYGVKTSQLTSNQDYWNVAKALWPDHITASGSLEDLQRQIKALPRKLRKQIARSNVHHVPPHLLSNAPIHEKALRAALAGGSA
jgi:hypothetical protein